MGNLDALRAAIDGIRIEDNEKIVQQKSRDFYWYSPVLKERLDHVTGDLIVSPKDEDELIRVLKACFAHDVPVTPRGTGTGNYGQAMPLSGGVVLSLADMNEIKEIAPGRVVCGPGVICADLDKAARESINPDRLIWVVVGDASVVKPQLDALGIPVEVRSAAPAAVSRPGRVPGVG